MQDHLVEIGLSAEIHVDPFLCIARTHPDAVETGRRFQFDIFPAIEEIHVVDRPVGSSRHPHDNTVMTVLSALLHGNLQFDDTHRKCSLFILLVRIRMHVIFRSFAGQSFSGDLSQLSPAGPVVRSLTDQFIALAGFFCIIGHCPFQINPVCLFPVILQIKLEISIFTGCHIP